MYTEFHTDILKYVFNVLPDLELGGGGGGVTLIACTHSFPKALRYWWDNCKPTDPVDIACAYKSS